ncbi:serralysin [Pseudomonas sp. W3I7]|jgi:hypothetical protein|uniref:M10 family metallopeptidase C-terminal domain-containing protein n=1 Tax=Pseudomonas sp. W3I7 TaxID=3042292 RepID=UPI00279015E1|nr:M10 family metallopeptidase C-terminal domain-containing protein [Pseudomonas sp. W3I7]MDQ0705038.1 serralysin [Pseudomonas sp. W3I7]
MSVSASSGVSHSPTSNSLDPSVSAGTASSGSSNAADRPRWVDKNNNGKIDIEVDFTSGAGDLFNKHGFKEYREFTPLQQQELLAQMHEISLEANVEFHLKGTIDNPDGKVKFGNFAPQVGKRNPVEVFSPAHSDGPVEAYVRADADNLNPSASNKGGNALARALLQALGLPVSNEDSQGYSILGRQPETATGHDFKGKYATRPQIKDVEALVKKFGQNFDYESIVSHVNHLGKEGKAVTMTIGSGSLEVDEDGEERYTHDTINAAGDTNDQQINLKPGTFSSVGGFKNNVAITSTTDVEDVITGAGTNRVIANAVSNKIELGSGANTVVYENISDSSSEKPDQIVGFKSGIDKVDVSAFYSREKFVDAENPRLILDRKENGETWLRCWTNHSAENKDRPDFSLRVDGARSSDIMTGPHILTILSGGIPDVKERTTWYGKGPN